MQQDVLETAEQGQIAPDLVRPGPCVAAVSSQGTRRLADVPLDRMKAIRAIGQVPGADVLARGKDSMWRCSSNADTPWLVI